MQIQVVNQCKDLCRDKQIKYSASVGRGQECCICLSDISFYSYIESIGDGFIVHDTDKNMVFDNRDQYLER